MAKDMGALRKKLLGKARKKVEEKYSGKEQSIVRAVGLSQDLDDAFNLLAEQVIEWYGGHFPELQRTANNSETYIRLVAELGSRENFAVEKIEETGQSSESAEKISQAASKSMGAEFDEETFKRIKEAAKKSLALRDEKKEIADYIEKEMSKEMPNFTALAGANIGAKLLAEAGSKERLAKMPSSTIQVLGAEKALFSHLKKGTKCPKHGVIFQHPLLKKVPRRNRGKISRALAGKLAIAAREDFFGKSNNSKELVAWLEKRAEDLAGPDRPIINNPKKRHRAQISNPGIDKPETKHQTHTAEKTKHKPHTSRKTKPRHQTHTSGKTKHQPHTSSKAKHKPRQKHRHKNRTPKAGFGKRKPLKRPTKPQ